MIPSSCLIAKSVNSKSELSHVANDIIGEVKEHVFGKTVGRMPNQGPFSRSSAPLIIGSTYYRLSVYCCTLLGVCWKKAPNIVDAWSWGPWQIDWDQWAHSSAASVGRCRSVPNHPWLTEYVRTNNHWTLSSAAYQPAKSFSLSSCCIGSENHKDALPLGTSLTVRALNHIHAWCTKRE